MIEIEIIFDDDDRPTQRDWIPEADLQPTLLEIAEAGLRAVVIGPVSWQRQLAAMENPPL